MPTKIVKDYYIKQKAELMINFSEYTNSLRKLLVEKFDDAKIDKILKQVSEEYEKLIPKIPYIGGDENPSTISPIRMISNLAIFRTLEKEGFSYREIGELFYEFGDGNLRLEKERMEKIGIDPAQYRFEIEWINYMKLYTEFSQKRVFPYDFVYEFVEGDGISFDWGLDISECIAYKLYKKLGAEKYVPFECMNRILQAKIMGFGSFRTQALATGAPTCDYRFVKKLKAPQKITEEEVTYSKEKKICLVCKGDIASFNNYICPKCEVLYCDNCAQALLTLEKMCWVCETPLDESKLSMPVLLAIISKTGYMVLTNPFSVEIPFDEDRVGEFISFFNSISGQMFSKSLDRAKFGEYTLLLKTLNSFSFCYLFEGYSYLAQQRLNNFYETVKNDGSILEILNTAIHVGQVINLKENPKLETMIAECFLSDQQKFQVTPEKEGLQKLVKKSRRIRKLRASHKERSLKIFIAETIIEIIALLLFLTSHLLFLAIQGELELSFPFIPPETVGDLFFIELTLYLGIGCHLIVLNIVIINWLKEIQKNRLVTAEIIIQIFALLLILTAHIFYLESVDKTSIFPKLGLTPYTLIIDFTLFPGIACLLMVVVLILVDYIKQH